MFDGYYLNATDNGPVEDKIKCFGKGELKCLYF